MHGTGLVQVGFVESELEDNFVGPRDSCPPGSPPPFQTQLWGLALPLSRPLPGALSLWTYTPDSRGAPDVDRGESRGKPLLLSVSRPTGLAMLPCPGMWGSELTLGTSLVSSG